MRPTPFPTHVQIQTTPACGAACTICPHPVESPRWARGRMDETLFASIVEQLRGRPVEHLCPYLMSDALSDREIFERIGRLRQALPQAHFELSTTALYLAGPIAGRLLEAPLNELRISCHGLSAEEWAATMPGLRFERDWPRLEQFLERWRTRRPWDLRIVMLRGLFGAERDAEIEAYWSRRGVEVIRWDLITRAEQVDLTVHGDVRARLSGRPGPAKLAPPWTCRFRRDLEWLHILKDGRVTLCCMDYRHEEILGDLRNQSIEEIWRGAAFAQARRRVRGEVPAGDDFLCHRCEWHASEAAIGPAAAEPALAGQATPR